MTTKEFEIQLALGTMKPQMFVQTDWKDTARLIEEFIEAIENFGLFVYDDPDAQGSDSYGFIISHEQLTDAQINTLCENDDLSS